MYDIEQLVNLNNSMLRRGAPVWDDGIGYNKPDFSICKHYHYGLSDSQLADLATRLVKYCKTQLNMSADEMQETVDYYKKKAGSSTKKSVSVSVSDDYTVVAFVYDPALVSLVKTARNRKWNGAEKLWYVHNSEIVQLLQRMQKDGVDCKNAIEHVKAKLKNRTIIKLPVQETTPKITVKDAGNKLVISFPYEPKVVSAVKTLSDRKYNPDNRSWTIGKTEVNDLLDRLDGVDVDKTELEKYRQEVIMTTLVLPKGLAKDPFQHQIQAGEFLLNRKKAILADEMGGGKTYSSILASSNIKGKKLVVCPASLKLNWQKEIYVLPKQRAVIIDGQNWHNCSGWTIINYDILGKHIDKILQSDFQVVIFDESHYCKAVSNSGKADSQRAENFLKIANTVPNVYLLTGTPITNHTKDVFNLIKAINHPLSRSFFNFAKRYCGAEKSKWGWNFNGSSNTEELHDILKPFMMRRLKSEMLDLPAKMRSFVPVEVNLRAYMQKVDEYMENRKSLTTQGEHLVYLNALRHFLAKEKVSHTIEMAKNVLEQGEQVVIMTNYKFVVEQLLNAFGDKAVKLTGDCTTEQRQQAVDDFQAGRKQVFIGNLIASGVGITLTKCKNMIINDYDWIPSNHAQAEDRIHRIGQTEKVNIMYVYADKTFDVTITNKLENKLNNISQIIDGKADSFIAEIIDAFALVA